jgi:vancomycin resistance protein YoaR
MTTTLDPAIAEPASAETTAETIIRPHRLRTRFLLAFLLGLLAVLAVGAGAMYAYDQQYVGRILPGVHVGNLDLSGLTADEAAARLHSEYDRLADGTIIFVAGDKRLSLAFNRIDRSADVDGMVAQAMGIGRAGSAVERAIANARTYVRGVTVEPTVTYDPDKLARWVKTLASLQLVWPANATIERTRAGYQITEAVPGQQADPTAAIAILSGQLGRLDAPSAITVDLPLTTIPPAVTTDQARAAVDAANRIAADIRIVDGKRTWTIYAARIRSWISFSTAADGSITPVLDDSGLDPILKTLGQKINQTARDAGLALVSGHVVATSPSREGRTLDAAGMKTAIISEIGARQAGAAASPVAAVVKTVDPKLTTAAAKGFAPKMRLISSYSVYYFVIVNNHWGGNIEAPATKINGTVVPAGTIFDFWKVVGDLHKLPGEGPGNAIEGGKITVTGAFGGGICTTSTTLFNAAFRAGMVPLARQNHNEFINRYPPGLDATVWIVGTAKQTMSFKNDTEYPILITRTVTDAGSRRWLTFKIWSVPNGRTYKISNLVIRPGPRAIDTVVNDPTKPVGYYFRNNSPVDGAKVWVTVTIYDHGKLHWSNRYFSNYPAVNGVLVKGTRS